MPFGSSATVRTLSATSLALAIVFVGSAFSKPPVRADQPPTCTEGLSVERRDWNRILEWSKQLTGETSIPVLHCRLAGRKFVVGVSNAPSLQQGYYLLDLSRPPYQGEVVYAERLDYPGFPLHEEVLIDKSRTPHFLYCTERLSQGVLYYACGLLNLTSLQATNLFSGVSDQGEGCPPDFAGRSFDRAGWYGFKVTDWNRDGYRDVIVTGTEENCKTHKRVRIKRVFVAATSGFRKLKLKR